jgi:hypothetical protein
LLIKSKGMVSGEAATLLLVCLIVAGPAKSQPKKSADPAPRSVQVQVVPDLQQRVAKFRQVEMPFGFEGLSAREKDMVLKLVEACRYLEDIYWRQVDPGALSLYNSLEGSNNPQDVTLRRFLWINGSRFDLLNGDKPFVAGLEPSPWGGFYPQGITRDEIEAYVKVHPEKRAEIYSSTTIVRRKGTDLEGIPYHISFREFLEPAAQALRDAADLSSDEAFAKFLRLRADALVTDKYFESDVAWLELKRPKVDIIFAPYETYNDDLLGVKATYGGSVMIREEAESRRMETFQKYVADIQDALPIPERDRPSKRGLETPMEVVDVPFRTADLGHGYQAVADNLPNDPHVHELKGSKKMFFKNFMDARVNYVILPLAKYMMPAEQVDYVSGDGYLLSTILHEICHGLGPAFAHNSSGDKIDIRQAIGPSYGGLEEAKADVVGMFALKWLVDHGVLPKKKLREYYASYLAGNFRTLRFGAAEAHGQAEMMEFNYYVEHGAVRRLPSGKYEVDYEKMPVQIEALAKELLLMEASGDRARVEAWFKKYDVISPDLRESLARADSIPVDIDPTFSFPRAVR